MQNQRHPTNVSCVYTIILLLFITKTKQKQQTYDKLFDVVIGGVYWLYSLYQVFIIDSLIEWVYK